MSDHRRAILTAISVTTVPDQLTSAHVLRGRFIDYDWLVKSSINEV